MFGLVLAREIGDYLRYALKATSERISCRELKLDVQLGPPIR